VLSLFGNNFLRFIAYIEGGPKISPAFLHLWCW